MSIDASVTDPAEGGSGTATYTMEFFDFGLAVDVDEPPADQVVSLAELARMPPG